MNTQIDPNASNQDVIQVLDRSFKNCRLGISSAREQTYWPVRSLIDLETNRELSMVFHNEKNGLHHRHTIPSTPFKAAEPSHHVHHDIVDLSGESLLSAYKEVHRRSGRGRKAVNMNDHLARHYPSVASEWNGVVPALPNYCGISNGTLDLDTVTALKVTYALKAMTITIDCEHVIGNRCIHSTTCAEAPRGILHRDKANPVS